jgi:hypothetical protein
LPHLVGGIEESPLALDLLVDGAEGIVVVIHDGYRRRVSAHGDVSFFSRWTSPSK